jgi:hypothetical protein
MTAPNSNQSATDRARGVIYLGAEQIQVKYFQRVVTVAIIAMSSCSRLWQCMTKAPL